MLSGGYSVSVPELPGCFTEGETAVEIRGMVQEAIGLWLDATRTAAANSVAHEVIVLPHAG